MPFYPLALFIKLSGISLLPIACCSVKLQHECCPVWALQQISGVCTWNYYGAKKLVPRALLALEVPHPTCIIAKRDLQQIMWSLCMLDHTSGAE